MDIDKILERIRKYQEEPVFHELTCGNDSRHAVLKALLTFERGIILVCPDCDYIQTHIPDMFFHDDFDEFYQQQKKLIEKFSLKGDKDNVDA